MEKVAMNNYKNTFEFWHKGSIVLNIKLETFSKECASCQSSDLDVVEIHSADPIHGEISISFYCRDCDHIETEVYPVISRRQIEKNDPNSNKIDDLLKNSLQIKNL